MIGHVQAGLVGGWFSKRDVCTRPITTSRKCVGRDVMLHRRSQRADALKFAAISGLPASVPIKDIDVIKAEGGAKSFAGRCSSSSNHEADDAPRKKGVEDRILRNQPACPPSADGRLDSGQSAMMRESAKIVTIEIIHRQETKRRQGFNCDP
jgi:hypothetical protein